MWNDLSAVADRKEVALGRLRSSQELTGSQRIPSASGEIYMAIYVNTPLVRLSLQLLPLPLDMLLSSTFLWTTMLGTIE